MTKEEIAFVQEMEAKGYRLHRAGWPDYLVVGNGETRFVEVKSWMLQIAESQVKMLTALSCEGFDVSIWTPEDGFIRWGSSGINHGGLQELRQNRALKAWRRMPDPFDSKVGA